MRVAPGLEEKTKPALLELPTHAPASRAMQASFAMEALATVAQLAMRVARATFVTRVVARL